MAELLQMWALVEVLGFVCLPLTMTVFHNLPDRGWAFGKVIGIAVLAFFVWLPLMYLHALPFNQFLVAGVFLILLAFNLVGFLQVRHTIVKVVRVNFTYILISEAVFAGMMFLLGWIRSYVPDIRSFEMFMDEGFIAAIMRSPHFPPNDMWFSGHSINYYYYAHFTAAALAKLLGQSPSIAFNTGISTFYGLTAVSLFGVTCNIVSWAQHQRKIARLGGNIEEQGPDTSIPSLTRAAPYGLLTMLMGLILGNLAATQQWWENHGDLTQFNWFDPSRVVDRTINEFPAFSFLLSCFHAHVLALAFTILAIALAFNLFLEQQGKGLRVFGRGWRLPMTMGTTALILGGLFTMNGWDFPTYVGLTVVCITLQQWLVYQSRFCLELLLDVFTACAGLIALAFILYVPFYLNFISPSQGLGFIGPADRSSLSSELLIYGMFAFVFLSLLFARAFKPPYFLHSLKAIPATELAPQFESHSCNEAGASVWYPPLQLRSLVSFLFGIHRFLQLRSLVPLLPPVSSDARKYLRSAAMQGSTSGQQRCKEVPPVSRDEGIYMNPAAEISSPPASVRVTWLNKGIVSVLIVLVAAVATFFLLHNSATFVLVGSIAVLGFMASLFSLRDRPQAFTLLLGSLAFTLVAACEVVFLKDVFAGGDFLRMNTVFKFYFQAWALLSITSGAGLYFILESFRPEATAAKAQRWLQGSVQWLWLGGLFLLLLASAVYPLAGTYARTNHYMQRSNSLDGINYLQNCKVPDCDYDTSGDYAAIRWLNGHVSGDPIIVEAVGDDYTSYARISAFTGLPTPMGWIGHEYQWRVNWLNNGLNAVDFDNRKSDIETIYTDPHPTVVRGLLARYHVQYLYVGLLEHMKYPTADLHRFSVFLHVVYSANGVTIYQVN